MAAANLSSARKQFAGSAKAAEEALRQLTEERRYAQLFERDVIFLKMQMASGAKRAKARDVVTGSVPEQS